MTRTSSSSPQEDELHPAQVTRTRPQQARQVTGCEQLPRPGRADQRDATRHGSHTDLKNHQRKRTSQEDRKTANEHQEESTTAPSQDSANQPQHLPRKPSATPTRRTSTSTRTLPHAIRLFRRMTQHPRNDDMDRHIANTLHNPFAANRTHRTDSDNFQPVNAEVATDDRRTHLARRTERSTRRHTTWTDPVGGENRQESQPDTPSINGKPRKRGRASTGSTRTASSTWLTRRNITSATNPLGEPSCQVASGTGVLINKAGLAKDSRCTRCGHPGDEFWTVERCKRRATPTPRCSLTSSTKGPFVP